MKVIGIFIALAVAAVGAFFALKYSAKEEAPQTLVASPTVVTEKVPTVDVLIAKSDIPIGTVLSEDMLDIQPWPQHLLLPQFVAANENDPNPAQRVIKMVTRTPFQAQEPIIMNKLANPNDPSFIAANLPKGMRAVTIRADMVSGVAGFALPGDRVDVLLTHHLATDSAEIRKTGKAPKEYTEVLLSNIKIIALNQVSTAGTPPVPEGEPTPPPPQPASFSLEVTQEDAQKLRLAEDKGQLSLALRSLHDRDDTTIPEPTAESDLSSAAGKEEDNTAQLAAAKVKVVRGSAVENVELQNGATDAAAAMGGGAR